MYWFFFHFSRISRYCKQCKKTLASLRYLGNQVLQFFFITTAQNKMQKLLWNFLQALLWERRAKFQRKIINFTRLRALRSSDFHKPKTRFLLNNNSFSNIKYRLLALQNHYNQLRRNPVIISKIYKVQLYLKLSFMDVLKKEKRFTKVSPFCSFMLLSLVIGIYF